jgi:hypothetical protein
MRPRHCWNFIESRFWAGHFRRKQNGHEPTEEALGFTAVLDGEEIKVRFSSRALDAGISKISSQMQCRLFCSIIVLHNESLK